jgi:hypothetical protein
MQQLAFSAGQQDYNHEGNTRRHNHRYHKGQRCNQKFGVCPPLGISAYGHHETGCGKWGEKAGNEDSVTL